MSGAGGRVDIPGMPHRKPFAWILAAAMSFSAAGLVATQLSAPAGAVSPSFEASAAPASEARASYGFPTVVTEETPWPEPTAAPATATPEPTLAVVTTTEPPPTASPEPAPASTVQAAPARIAPVEQGVVAPAKAAGLLDKTNAARVEDGLPPLERVAVLDDVALARARNLLANGYFDHYSPDGESAFSELGARGVRYRLAGENLARNNYIESRTVEAAFDGLMASPGHRANILEEGFSQVGVAAVQSGKVWIYVTVFLN
jgi:uncharacterized protein YkwD